LIGTKYPADHPIPIDSLETDSGSTLVIDQNLIFITDCERPDILVSTVQRLRRSPRQITLISPLLDKLGVGKRIEAGIRSWVFPDPSLGRSNRLKRMMDVVFSCLAILILSPIMALVALSVTATSAGQ